MKAGSEPRANNATPSPGSLPAPSAATNVSNKVMYEPVGKENCNLKETNLNTHRLGNDSAERCKLRLHRTRDIPQRLVVRNDRAPRRRGEVRGHAVVA